MKPERGCDQESGQRVVHKYALDIDDETFVSMPAGAVVLDVQTQHGVPQIWALVDPDRKLMIGRRFRVAGTGHPIDWQTNMRHRGTFQMRDGGLVFHLFESL